jgi:prolipoprotein diacylglyceryl transferase
MNNLLYIHWNVDPIIFKLGIITITYYGTLFVGGLFLCSYILKKVYNEDKIPESTFFSLTYHCFLGIAIGARLGHCLFYQPDYYLSHPFEMILPFGFENGTVVFTGYRGLASHGGTIGLITVLILYSGKKRQNIINTFDYLAIVAPLGACFIRLANLMNSEIIGNPTDVPWAFIFERVDFLPRHPAQLYEAIFYFSLFILTYRLHKTRKKLKTGFLFGIVLFLIFIFRFFVEFLKERQVDFENSMYLDMGQLLSIPFIVVGLYFIFMYKDKTSKQCSNIK